MGKSKLATLTNCSSTKKPKKPKRKTDTRGLQRSTCVSQPLEPPLPLPLPLPAAMSIFETYEREFSGLMADITRKTNSIPDMAGGTFFSMLLYSFCGCPLLRVAAALAEQAMRMVAMRHALLAEPAGAHGTGFVPAE